ncbi:MAG: hypothetical protein WC683_02025 [bacterium]
MPTIDLTDTKPWTWKQIAKLRDEKLKQFVSNYGYRGKAAIMAAWMMHGAPFTAIPCCWPCARCPMSAHRLYMHNSMIRNIFGCENRALPVYVAMTAKLGYLPEEDPR